jgi:hypothetical protein
VFHRILTLACLLTFQGFAQAEPTIRGSWQLSCGPSVVETTLGAGGWLRLNFSQGGADSVARIYRLAIEISAPGSGSFPDAWRFDAAGCQGPFALDFATWIPTPIKTCPSNMPAGPYSIGYGVTMDEADGRLRIEFHREHLQPGPISGSIDRLLLGLLFSHERSVPGVAPDADHCGDVDRGMCIQLVESTHESFSGHQMPHTRLNTTYVVNAGGGGGTCGAVPARATTWGQIKAQYD